MIVFDLHLASCRFIFDGCEYKQLFDTLQLIANGVFEIKNLSVISVFVAFSLSKMHMMKPSQVDRKSLLIFFFFIKFIENLTENIDLSSESDFKLYHFFVFFGLSGLRKSTFKNSLTLEKLFYVYEYNFVFEL